MKSRIEHWSTLNRRQFRTVYGRLPHLVDFTVFGDALADQVGCKPGDSDLKLESRQFHRRFRAGPLVAAQYRLCGPGARPDIARRTVESVPIAHPWPQHVSLALRWCLNRILQRLLGADYAPKLTIR
jgi:dimethylaniline monooxygenase (N-oxide forming)